MKILLVLLIGCCTAIAQTKFWMQTSAAEFLTGGRDSVDVEQLSDGEVQLQHPFVQRRSDTLNMPVQRFVSTDSSGNYLKAWVSAKQVMVQKFSEDHTPISGIIPVSDRLRTDGDKVGVALMDGGEFAVTWSEYFDSSNGYSYSLRYLQFFNASNERIGGNRRIFNASNATHSIPQPITDNVNRRYFIVGAEGNSTNGFKSYGWFFRSNGEIIGDSLKIVTSSITKNEYHIRGANFQGRYLLTWAGDNTNTGPNDVYAMFLDSIGSPLTGPMLLNSVYKKAMIPIAAFDKDGNSAVAWIDTRKNQFGNVYAQLFDPFGKKVSGEKALTKSPVVTQGGIYSLDIAFLKGQFHISWELSYSDGQPPQLWSGFWGIDRNTHGTFTSPLFDAGNSQIVYDSLFWSSVQSNGTSIAVQLRTSNSQEQIGSAPWKGSDDVHSVYTSGTGSAINPVHNQHRYIQYRLLFASDTLGITPVLHDITVRYRSMDTIPPIAPVAVTATGTHRKITLSWQKSVAGDVKFYRIFRTREGEQFTGSPLTEVNAATTVLLDSSAITGTIYIYGIQAVDSTYNSSTLVISNPAGPRTMTIFVSKTGSVTGDGTFSKPMASIMAAMDFAGMLDTVIVLPGEYSGPITVKDNVSLIGSGIGNTKILFTEGSGIAVMAGNNTVIKGFTLLVTTGIRCAGNNVTITENALLHQGTDWHVGISTGFTSSGAPYSGIVISKNYIMDFWMGIHTIGGASNPSSVLTTIRNNVIRSSVGVQVVRNSVDVISNTFIVQGTSIGMTFSQGSATVMNNCFAGYPAPGHPLRSISRFGASVYLEYNNFWNFPGDNDTLMPSNIKVDPLFVNAARNRFTYRPSSPCIDAGNPHPAYNDPDGTRNDLGAYGSSNAMSPELSIQTSADLSMANSSGFTQDTISNIIRVSSAAGMATFECELMFDPAIAVVKGVRALNLPQSGNISTFMLSDRSLRFRIERGEELTTAAADIAAIDFIVRSDLPSERRSSVEFGSVSILDADGARIAVNSIVSGLIVGKVRMSDTNLVFVDLENIGPMDGSIEHPYTTVQQGIDHASTGDTVVVSAGVYSGNIVMKSGVVVKGMGATVTVLQIPNNPSNPDQWVVKFKDVVNSGLIGCSVVNLSQVSSTIDIDASHVFLRLNKISTDIFGSYSVHVRNGSEVLFSDNVFTEHETSIGSMLTVIGSTGTFTRNTFLSRGGMDVVNLNTTHNIVFSNNTFIADAGYSNILREGSCSGTIIRNNLFLVPRMPGEGISSDQCVGTQITNNIFDIKNIAVRGQTSAMDVRNNIFIDNTTALLLNDSTLHRYNLYWNTSAPIPGKPLDPTEVIADPLFINRASLNYSLATGSPAKDGGDPADIYRDADSTRNNIGLFGGPYADHSLLVSSRAKLTVSIVDAGPDDTVIVPIIGSGMAGLSGLQAVVGFDEQKIALIDIHTAEQMREYQLTRKNIGTSLVLASIAGHTAKNVDSLPVMLLTFIVKHTASGFASVKIGSADMIAGQSNAMPVGTIVSGGINLGPAGTREIASDVPEHFILSQNYPNPFNPSTRIEFSLPKQSLITLKIYDVIGREVTTIVSDVMDAGRFTAEWDGTNAAGRTVASGMYFYRLTAGSFVQTKKMMLMR